MAAPSSSPPGSSLAILHSPFAIRYLILLELWLLFALLALGARMLPATADEPAHIAVGYAMLARGAEARALLPGYSHPPLLGMLEAAPLYLANPHVPLETLPGWPTNYDAYYRAFRPHLAPEARTLFAARLTTLLLTVLLGALVYRWAASLWTPAAGCLALTALLFDPTLLAHGRLATTDLGATALGWAALYLTWRWARRRTWQRAVAAGGVLGLALLAKISSVVWAAAIGLLLVGYFVRACGAEQMANGKWQMAKTVWRGQRPTTAIPPTPHPFSLLRHSLLLVGSSFLTLWAGYGFTWGAVGTIPVPLPAPAYWESFLHLSQFAASSWSFALGQRLAAPVGWYFPLAFLIKNPLPLLLALGWSLLTLLRRPARVPWAYLTLFPLLYLALAIYSGVNIGYRHFYPLHPFIYLLIAAGGWRASKSWRAAGKQTWPLVVLGCWYIVGTARMFPYEIAYFNELIGGPAQGYHYLVDSNLDWGQFDHLTQSYLEAHPTVQSAPPTTRLRPAPGRYAVGASYLQGVGITDPLAYEWFRHQTPRAQIHYGLLEYEVAPFPVTWIAQCAPPVRAEALARGLGQTEWRPVEFACAQAWLYPGGGEQTGLYVLPRALLAAPHRQLPSLLPAEPLPRAAFVARRLQAARLSFEQPYDGAEAPAFVLYEQAEFSLPPNLRGASIAPAGSLPTSSTPLAAPVPLGGPLNFLGALVYPAAPGLEVETWWEVTRHPDGRPFSLAAHLLDANGQMIEGADGLGVAVDWLLPGDVLVQRHHFADAPEAGKLWLRVNGYWLDTPTPELWPVGPRPAPKETMLFVPLR